MKTQDLKKLIREEINTILKEESNNYMFFSNLKTIKDAVDKMLQMDPTLIDNILSKEHGWALDHIATSKDDVEEVYNFLKNEPIAEEKTLSRKQKNIAKLAPPEDKITDKDFTILRNKK
jgi:hypothetical protein